MEGFCRGCLNKFDEPTDLIQYCESNRRLFVYSTGLQVKRNDAFKFQLCNECYLNMKLACKFKKQCRNSDKKFKNYLAYKEDGDIKDFSAYLKNVGDTLRLSKLNRSSTPAHQRIQDSDDDNESTCTSIQNFMTDMLEGEEMPPTEAQIIREVIQEEADILDDSLDSHWLQEDMSIDLGTDFNFSAFSTPRSINNDHCYTPKRLNDDKEDSFHYFARKIIERPDGTTIQQNDMPILDDCGIQFGDIVDDDKIVIDSLKIEYRVESTTDAEKQQSTDMPILDCGIEFDGDVGRDITIGDLETEFMSIECYKESDKKCNTAKEAVRNDICTQNRVKIITPDYSPLVKLDSFKDNLFSISNGLSPLVKTKKSKNEKTLQHVTLSNENAIAISLKKDVGKNCNESPLTCELEYYLNKGNVKEGKNIKISDNGGSLYNGKEFNMTINSDKANKIINQSPLTHDLAIFTSNSKVKKEFDLISNSTDQILNILKATHNSTNIVQQTEGSICVAQNVENGIDDSPIKHELEQYINKVEVKKKTNQVDQNKTKGANDSIDKNLELALKNKDNKEFSLEQLLLSPQGSIRSGASTPTISKILFGSMTPNNKDSNIEPILKDIQEPNPIDFIEEFLIDGQSTPIKNQINLNERNFNLKVKNIIELKDDKEIKQKDHSKQTKGFKDIKTLKKIFKLENDDQNSNLSEDEESALMKDVQLDNIKKSIRDEITEQTDEIEDLDISISKLLHIEHSHSDIIDPNLSISSDFLKYAENIDESDSNCMEPFKRPFTPPDNGYDLEKSICLICDKMYVSQRALSIHFAKKHKFKIPRIRKRAKTKICHVCAKAFTDKSNLNKHLKTHEEQGHYECEICTLIFTSRGKLSQHMRAHNAELKKEEKKEIQNDNSKDKKKYVCVTCGQVSTTMSNYKVHQMRHTKSYKFNCIECGKGFYRATDLAQHESIHLKLYPFPCKYCPKKYRRRDLLMAHTYRHLGLKKFACEVCDVEFNTKQHLRNHFSSLICMKKAEKIVKETTTDTKLATVSNLRGSNTKVKKIMTTNEQQKKEIPEKGLETSEVIENPSEIEIPTTPCRHS